MHPKASLSIWADLSSRGIHQLVRAEKGMRMSRWLLAIAVALDGLSRDPETVPVQQAGEILAAHLSEETAKK